MTDNDRTSFLITYVPEPGFPSAQETAEVMKHCFTQANNWQPEGVFVMKEDPQECIIRLVWPKDRHPKTDTVYKTLYVTHDWRVITDIKRESSSMTDEVRANMLKIKSLISRSGLSKKSGKVTKKSSKGASAAGKKRTKLQIVETSEEDEEENEDM